MSNLIRKILQERFMNESKVIESTVNFIDESEISDSDKALNRSSFAINDTLGYKKQKHDPADHSFASNLHLKAFKTTDNDKLRDLHHTFSTAHRITSNVKTNHDHNVAAAHWQNAEKAAKKSGHVSFSHLANAMNEYHLNKAKLD